MASESLGMREYARHRKASGLSGGSLRAVQVAITTGRLSKSLTADGKHIAIAAEADAEWEATTLADRRAVTAPVQPGATLPELAESRARREAAQAALAEIELAEKRGELVLAIDVESELVSVFAHCKTKLLAVASRARQRDPGLTGAQVELFKTLIREALDDLATEGEA